MREEQLSVIQGLATHKEKQLVWELPCASEPEGQAAGSYSVAQGALQGIFGYLGGGHVVGALEMYEGTRRLSSRGTRQWKWLGSSARSW